MAADQEGSVEAGEQSGLSCRTLRETRNPERGVGRKDRAAVRRRDLTPEAAEPSSPGYGQGVSIRLRLTQAEAVYENEKGFLRVNRSSWAAAIISPSLISEAALSW